MEKDLSNGNIGTVGKYDIDYKDGAVIATISAQSGPLKISASAELEAIDVAIQGLKIVKDKIPGHIDDLIIDSGIAALEALRK